MPDSVRCKFYLAEVTNIAQGTYRSAKLTFVAQYDESIPEDRRFQKASPNGRFEITIDNPVAVEFFKLGQFYYFDATPAN